MDRGYWKFWRKTEDSGLFRYPFQFTVWCYLLTKVSHNNHTYPDGTEVQPGQVVTSVASISAACGLSTSCTRTVLKNLKRSKRIEILTNPQHSLITIIKWELYQPAMEASQTIDKPLANGSQTIDKRLTTTKNSNSNSNSKKKEEYIRTKEVIDYLNQETGKNFNPKTDATVKLINGRFGEGYSLDDFKRVIDNKIAEWLSDPEMVKFLRPATLFAPSKFDDYLQTQTVKKQQWVPPEKRGLA